VSGLFSKLVAALLVLGLAAPAMALDKRMKKQLMKLDPAVRLEQTCDTGAMEKIRKDKTPYRADRVVAYAFQPPEIGKNSVKAPGAAVRSRGEWYRLSYECTTDSDNIEIRALTYHIGEKIPSDQWEKHNLYQ
jgi:hypothetical protein